MSWGQDVFRPLETFERRLSELYGAFAKKFGNDAETAKFFSKLSRDSNTLKGQLEFLHRLAKQLGEALPEPTIDMSRVAIEIQALERITGLIEHVGIDAAVSQALQFECGTSKRISQDAIAPVHEDLAKMVCGFGVRKDADHAELLMQFAMKRNFNLPHQVVQAAQATIAHSKQAAAEAAMLAQAAKARNEKLAAERAAEEAELEKAVAEGKSMIDLRLQQEFKKNKAD